MASKGAKAALLDTSLKELSAALAEISSMTGVPTVDIPTTNRDPELLVAYQVEAMATWAKGMVTHLKMLSALTGPEKSARADFSAEDGETPPEATELVTGLDVTPEGVVVATTPEGDVTSDGQGEPESDDKPESEQPTTSRSKSKKAKADGDTDG